MEAVSKNSVNLADMPLTARHYWIVFVTSLGQLIGTGVATLAGIIIPMLNILLHPELSSFMQGLLGCVDLIGIIFGSVIFGKLSDKYGYLLFFRLCPAICLVASVIAIIFPHVAVLTVCLFIVGLGIGGEYSLDSNYVSELMPKKSRSLMVGISKSASAFGNIIVAAICFAEIEHFEEANIWPRLLWIIAGISALMLICRIWFYESPAWLIHKGRFADAQKAVKEFLGDNVAITPDEYAPADLPPAQAKKETAAAQTQQKNMGLFSFIFSNGKKVILSGVPWACEGLGVYGIGVFLPILVMALGLEHFYNGEPLIMHVASSVKVTFWISCILIPGFIIGLYLINKGKSLTAIQSTGFWLCAASLILLIFSYHFKWDKWISIGAFMAFEMFLNMGPHLITFVLPPKIYTGVNRGLGVGIASAIGKIGAVLGVFVIPILLNAGGAILVLIVSVVIMALGAVITNIYGHLVQK